MATVRNAIQEAGSVLCVGAGPTGLETAGYLKEKYPDKTVGVCLRGKTLLPAYNGGHEKTEVLLNELGVEILYETGYQEGDQVKTKAGTTYEYVIDCRGFKFAGPSQYLSEDMKDCIDKKSGQILVDKRCRVTNVHPIASAAPPEPRIYQNIFSFGDVCLTPANEPKSIVSLTQMTNVVGQNISEQATGKPGTRDIPDKIMTIGMIPLGKNRGIFNFNRMTKSDNTVPQQKT